MRIILKWILSDYFGRVLVESSISGEGPVGICSKRDTELSDSIKFGIISRLLDEIVSSTGGYLLMKLDSVNDHPLYLVCPDLLRVVGETSYGIRVGFIRSTQTSLFGSVFVFMVYSILLWCTVYCYPVKETKNHILTTEKKTTVVSLQK